MPFPDVTALLTDPDFATTIELRVRQETVTTSGRAEFCDTWGTITAVVQPARGRDLIREDGSSRGSGTISVWCTTAMTVGELSDGGQRLGEDHIRFRAKEYVVTSVEDWLEWGAGFVKAIAEQDALVG